MSDLFFDGFDPLFRFSRELKPFGNSQKIYKCCENLKRDSQFFLVILICYVCVYSLRFENHSLKFKVSKMKHKRFECSDEYGFNYCPLFISKVKRSDCHYLLTSHRISILNTLILTEIYSFSYTPENPC